VSCGGLLWLSTFLIILDGTVPEECGPASEMREGAAFTTLSPSVARINCSGFVESSYKNIIRSDGCIN